jgi:hypothetical protein
MSDQSLPAPVLHFFRVECPACSQRFWNGVGATVGYPMHYASVHLGIPIWSRP